MNRPTPVRQEYEVALEPFIPSELSRALPLPQRIWRHGWMRKTLILVALAVLWEVVARIQDNDLLLPSFLQTAEAFARGMVSGELPGKIWLSLTVLVKGYVIGIALAFGLTTLAVSTQLGRFVIVQRSFAEMAAEADRLGLAGKISGVLLDLGVSSPQLDDPARGFSFLNDGPLDMRMNPDQGISAARFIAEAPEEEIARVFKEYGEERFARRMARAVVERRQAQPFERTADLAQVLKDANPAWEKNKHPATRAFQGLRIHVNSELADLEAGLQAALDILEVGGRLVVISFHSLEDRIVKLFLRRLEKGEQDKLPRNLPVQVQRFEPIVRTLGKARFASEAELKANPRSRSAVMRVAEKLR